MLVKQIFIAIINLFFIYSVSKSQEFEYIDKKVLNYPKSFVSIESLSNLINNDFSKPVHRVRAIYTWLAVNVKYDSEKKNKLKYGYNYYGWDVKNLEKKEFEYQVAKKIFLAKKGVCWDYANLFKVLCEFCSIECVIISGTAKTTKDEIGRYPVQTDHAWNAVKINNQWKLMDVTWTANYYKYDSTVVSKPLFNLYFFTDPEHFFTKHYPKSDNWLLIKKTPKEFAELPLFHRAYYFTSAKIVGPLKGEIILGKDRLVKIVLKNTKDVRVSFKFDFEKTSKRIKPRLKNDLCIYETTLGNVIVNYLTIYIDNQPFVTYKIT